MYDKVRTSNNRLQCREIVTRSKLDIAQCECGSCSNKVTIDNLHLFDFDHLDPSTKLDSISNLARHGRVDRLIEELRKCRLLFVTCHRNHTKDQQQHGYGFPAVQLEWTFEKQPISQEEIERAWSTLEDDDLPVVLGFSYIFRERDFIVTRDKNLHVIRCQRISDGKEYEWHQDVGYYEYTGSMSLVRALVKLIH